MNNFIILGVSKCGTTGLYKTICQHPQIVPAKTKELYFFGSHHYKLGIEWYEKQLGKCGKNQITGESTPPYFFRPCAKQIFDYNKNLKFIVMLRHPVERIISHYNHSKKYNEYKSFTEFLNKSLTRIDIHQFPYLKLHHIIGKSCYYPMVKYWFSFFPKEQFLFIKSEDYFANPQESLDKIYNFLNISEYKTKIIYANKGKYKAEVTEEDIKRLQIYYKPYNELLPELIGQNFRWGKNEKLF